MYGLGGGSWLPKAPARGERGIWPLSEAESAKGSPVGMGMTMEVRRLTSPIKEPPNPLWGGRDGKDVASEPS